MKRSLALLMALLLAGPVWAREDTLPEAARVTFTIGDSVPSGVVYERACPGALANFEQYGTDEGVLLGCSVPGDLGTCDTLAGFSASSPASGVAVGSGRPWFRWQVSQADAVGDSVLTLACSYMQLLSGAANARATVTQDKTVTTTVNLDGSTSSCDGGCTYLWSQTGGTACSGGITSATSAVTTATLCPYDEQLTFRLTVTSVAEPGESDSVDRNITLIDPETLLGCTFDAGTFPCTFSE